ncbi:Insecticide toxin TcdB like protein, partial [Herbaspirillum sp. CF444]|uniref:toxin TcdB middle/N-terminal domain-containing protein n=1 Tax=Herbaspirillum sp. CF444 TaxID=1144319 RepID=UPI0002726F0C
FTPQTPFNFGTDINSWDPMYWTYGDFNGDGKTDIIQHTKTANTKRVWLTGSPEQQVDLLVSITSNPTNVVNIKFLPLSNNAIYTKDSTSVYPFRDVQGAVYVVSSVSSANGVGGTTSTSYTYGGLKSDLSGRGLLGFRWMQAKQIETGLTSYTEYQQTWPYTGLPSLVKKSLTGGGNNGVLSQIANSYNCNDAANTTATACTVASGKRYFVYANQSIESGWDYNGAVLPVITTKTEYDNWGNATKVDVSTSDGYGKSTVNTYSNDSGNWYLGRLLKSSVTSTAP